MCVKFDSMNYCEKKNRLDVGNQFGLSLAMIYALYETRELLYSNAIYSCRENNEVQAKDL